jgi:hypothetical protein
MPKPYTILAVRDPDGGVDLRLWASHSEIDPDQIFTVVVDAGAGHEMADWMDTARSVDSATQYQKVADAIQEAFRNPPGSQYIRGWIDRDHCERQWVDTSLTDVDGLPTVLTFDQVEFLGLDGTGRTA